MKHILIFSNCAGTVIKPMFETHPETKANYLVNHIVNYESLGSKLDNEHIELLKTCDVFIYQPLNQHYNDNEYDISYLKQFLREHVLIFKVNYYRFKGFWYESEHKPYNNYGSYKFLDWKYYGIHNSFAHFQGNKADIILKIDKIEIPKEEFMSYFNEEVERLDNLDMKSDVKMLGFFLANYKKRQMFHDPFHPTNLFFYEIFRQIIFKIEGTLLDEYDDIFVNSLDQFELTHWSMPILPKIKSYLEIKTPDRVRVFFPKLGHGDRLLMLDIYDYYYIRVSPDNFKQYLENIIS